MASGDDEVIFVPDVPEFLQPVVASVPLRLFAYHMALLRGCDVDKPRNLAKSVTVESPAVRSPRRGARPRAAG